MLLRRFYDTPLAQASYLIGCQATGDAIVVDPNRDVEQYLAAANEEGVRITHVTETHIHADYLSGARELAARAGARLFLSAEGGPDWQYAFADEAGATLLRDGDAIAVGNLRLDVWHVPGHTPEHLAFVVTDTPATDRPMGMVTGDFLFVGDVGRPDLLEKAAGVSNTMEAGARDLWRSLRRLDALPDWLQVWPGHGAGSACGKALGAVPFSTLGYERVANWAFQAKTEDDFVREVLAGQPEPPRYFATMKRMNREGPPMRGPIEAPRRLDAGAIDARLAAGDVVIDLRRTAEFAAGHVRGTINLPLGNSFTTWAGSFVPYDRDLVIVGETEARARDAARALAMIGLDRVTGWVESAALLAARAATLESVPQLAPAELREWFAGSERPFTVLDVRAHTEWEAGHLPGVANLPLPAIPKSTGAIDRDQPVVLHCQGGGRSSVAASVLRAQGFTNVVNLQGGFRAWEEAGGEVER